MARHLTLRGLRTTLLARRPEQAEAMAADRRNPDYLPDLHLPAGLGFGVYPDHDLSSTDLVVMAVPSKGYAAAVAALAPGLPEGIGILSLTKGVEPLTSRRLSRVLEESLEALHPHIAVLAGPNHAEEISLDQPAATVIASTDEEFAITLQCLLSNENLRVYRNTDVIGVELASTVKNVIAIATGMGDGLGFGDNVRAALITRGLAEIARLGTAMGARPLTFSGLAGLGDLVGTCTSRHSRNRLAGELIAKGHSPDDVEREMGMVAEGLTAAPAVLRLAETLAVDMPITDSVVRVMKRTKAIDVCVRDLMGREPRAENH